jgi:hypothetical protein
LHFKVECTFIFVDKKHFLVYCMKSSIYVVLFKGGVIMAQESFSTEVLKRSRSMRSEDVAILAEKERQKLNESFWRKHGTDISLRTREIAVVPQNSLCRESGGRQYLALPGAE